MRFAGIECDDDALVPEIDFHTLHTFDFHEWSTQLSHAFVAIFAFGCDLDRFQDRMIGPLGIEGIARIWVVGSCRVHRFFILRARMAQRPSRAQLAQARTRHFPQALFGRRRLGGSRPASLMTDRLPRPQGGTAPKPRRF